MKIETISGPTQKVLRVVLQRCELFAGLAETCLNGLIELVGGVQVYDEGEQVIACGAAPEFFLVIVDGEAAVKVGEAPNFIEIARLGSGQMIGEMAMILNEPHTTAVFAKSRLTTICFSAEMFYNKLLLIHEVDVALMRVLADKIKQTSVYPSFKNNKKELPIPETDLLRLLPIEFMQRHRLVHIKRKANLLLIGYSGSVNQALLNSVARLLPGMELRPVYIDDEYFNRIMQSYAGEAVKTGDLTGSGTRHIDDLLRRLVEEGGSDLHLSAGQKPRWRINGEILEISGPGKLGAEEVLELLKPVARADILASFARSSDEDFAYSMGESCRFRINLLRDHNGISAVFRHIPNAILSLEALNMPSILQRFCDQPKGLVLVTGPTGSGKSTTLAAMINHINRSRSCHIVTVEDPIEFVHPHQMSVIEQREIGKDTETYSSALKYVLRQCPDVILVGEMRDLETIAAALTIAETGHLVFSTLHTQSSAKTIDRIIDVFPPYQQQQIRAQLASTLRGVISQLLLPRQDGRGRVAAREIMVVTPAVSNLIREGKVFQIPTAIQTGSAVGMQTMDQSLTQLKMGGLISNEVYQARVSKAAPGSAGQN